MLDEPPHLEPLMPVGADVAYSMTHFCPPAPEWDHLILHPDEPPIGRGANRRAVVYERE